MSLVLFLIPQAKLLSIKNQAKASQKVTGMEKCTWERRKRNKDMISQQDKDETILSVTAQGNPYEKAYPHIDIIQNVQAKASQKVTGMEKCTWERRKRNKDMISQQDKDETILSVTAQGNPYEKAYPHIDIIQNVQAI